MKFCCRNKNFLLRKKIELYEKEHSVENTLCSFATELKKIRRRTALGTLSLHRGIARLLWLPESRRP